MRSEELVMMYGWIVMGLSLVGVLIVTVACYRGIPKAVPERCDEGCRTPFITPGLCRAEWRCGECGQRWWVVMDPALPRERYRYWERKPTVVQRVLLAAAARLEKWASRPETTGEASGAETPTILSGGGAPIGLIVASADVIDLRDPKPDVEQPGVVGDEGQHPHLHADAMLAQWAQDSQDHRLTGVQ